MKERWKKWGKFLKYFGNKKQRTKAKQFLHVHQDDQDLDNNKHLYGNPWDWD